jgi:ABC-type multidrug transport system ATPase subunit
MINAKQVTKKFGSTRAVDGVSFELGASESLALWGSNGAGKTTLIRCLLGIFPFSGQATIGEHDVQRHGKLARAMVGYVPQELAFHDDARLERSIQFFAKLRGMRASDASRVLDMVDLSGHESKRVRDLSGGMKQRLALAIALIADPPIIVLDEPTSNLDASGRQEVVETLHRLRETGKTLLFASHRPDEVHTLASRVLVLEKGKLVKDVTPAQLWPTHHSLQTIRLHTTSENDDQAANVLREAGHTVNLNGHGLCVSVPHNRKGEPMTLLAQASIGVRDFEILENIEPSERIESNTHPDDALNAHKQSSGKQS